MFASRSNLRPIRCDCSREPSKHIVSPRDKWLHERQREIDTQVSGCYSNICPDANEEQKLSISDDALANLVTTMTIASTDEQASSHDPLFTPASDLQDALQPDSEPLSPGLEPDATMRTIQAILADTTQGDSSHGTNTPPPPSESVSSDVTMDANEEPENTPFSQERAAQYRALAASRRKQGLPRNRSSSPRPVPATTIHKGWLGMHMERLAGIEQNATAVLSSLDIPANPSAGYDQVVITALDQAAAEHAHLARSLKDVRSLLPDVQTRKQQVSDVLCSLDSTISRLGSLVDQSPRPDLPNDAAAQSIDEVPTGMFSAEHLRVLALI